MKKPILPGPGFRALVSSTCLEQGWVDIMDVNYKPCQNPSCSLCAGMRNIQLTRELEDSLSEELGQLQDAYLQVATKVDLSKIKPFVLCYFKEGVQPTLYTGPLGVKVVVMEKP